ncbi:hypothetical protein JYQ62_02900 [Nostoc sp. UHCC 0702]|nr:hypothetical protein JYQ62_02900 [Nostoc sp. UHCC 0702]
MNHKWIISLLVLPILALTYAYGSSNSRAQTKSTLDEIKPVLTVGLDQPVDISPNAEKILQGYGVQFKPVVPSLNLPVSAEKALEMANKTTLANLTQPPIKTTVEYLSYTDKNLDLVDKNVWRVVYWGSPLLMTGPPANPDGSTPEVKQPSSKKAITYVLIDPFDIEAKKDFITRVSTGPIQD